MEKVNKLLVCSQMIFWSSYNKSKVVRRHFTGNVASHTLVTYPAIQNGSQVLEKVNKLHVCPAEESKVWLMKTCHK